MMCDPPPLQSLSGQKWTLTLKAKEAVLAQSTKRVGPAPVSSHLRSVVQVTLSNVSSSLKVSHTSSFHSGISAVTTHHTNNNSPWSNTQTIMTVMSLMAKVPSSWGRSTPPLWLAALALGLQRCLIFLIPTMRTRKIVMMTWMMMSSNNLLKVLKYNWVCEDFVIEYVTHLWSSDRLSKEWVSPTVYMCSLPMCPVLSMLMGGASTSSCVQLSTARWGMAVMCNTTSILELWN